MAIMQIETKHKYVRLTRTRYRTIVEIYEKLPASRPSSLVDEYILPFTNELMVKALVDMNLSPEGYIRETCKKV